VINVLKTSYLRKYAVGFFIVILFQLFIHCLEFNLRPNYF